MSVIEPFHKTEDFSKLYTIITKTAQKYGVSLKGKTFTKGTVTDGIIFKKNYPKGIGAVWFFNSARNANVKNNRMVFDYNKDEYELIKKIAEDVAKETKIDIRLKPYSHRLTFVPMRYHG